MKLYFQFGKNKRIAIDTVHKTYNTNYFYLGAFHAWIKINRDGYNKLLQELDFACYNYSEDFFSNYSEEARQ